MTKRANAHIPDAYNIHRPVGGDLQEGAAVTSDVPAIADVTISGAGMVRIWGKCDVDGTLSFAYLNWGANGVYDTPAADDLDVTADTEFSQVLQLLGERGIRLTVTPADDGTVTYLDVAACVGLIATS
jgi:hypothetical protein